MGVILLLILAVFPAIGTNWIFDQILITLGFLSEPNLSIKFCVLALKFFIVIRTYCDFFISFYKFLNKAKGD